MKRPEESHAALLAAFSYDPNEGVFRYAQPGPHKRVGGNAGCINRKGYRYVYFAGRSHFAHRLAWFYVYGQWPEGFLDHVNGDRDDNRIANLRIATNSQNMANRKRNANSTTGVKGVQYVKKSRRYMARIQADGVRLELGYFVTIDEAKSAYAAKARELFGDFARLA